MEALYIMAGLVYFMLGFGNLLASDAMREQDHLFPDRVSQFFLNVLLWPILYGFYITVWASGIPGIANLDEDHEDEDHDLNPNEEHADNG